MTRKTTNNNTSITIYGTSYELANKDLAKNVNTMMSSLNGVNKSRWSYAQAVANIINNKYYADDFDDVKAFCQAVGLKNATVSKLVMACDFRNVSLQTYIKALKDNGIVESEEIVKNGMTVNKCYYLQSLVKIEKFVDFLLYIGEESTARIYKMSERELEELLSNFKKSLKGEEEEPKEEPKKAPKEETEQEEPKEATTNENTEMVEIIFQGSVYNIPRNILNTYKVKDINEETDRA